MIILIVSVFIFIILEHANKIDPLSIKTDRSNTSSSSIKITWKEPESPNGPIVTYLLEYNKVGDNNVRLRI